MKNKKRNSLYLFCLGLGISSTALMANTNLTLQDEVKAAQQKHIIGKDHLMGFSSDGRTLFQFATSDGQLLTAVDIDGLAYIGDMIVGRTEALKTNGLHIVTSEENEQRLAGQIDSARVTPQAGIIHPTSGGVWPNGRVPYVIDSSLGSNARSAMQYAINHWNSNTNIQLVPRTNETDYLSLQGGGGCSSWIGKQGGKQVVTLAEACGRGAAVHEIGHAVGFFHEQTRLDRDNFITINWNNIMSGMAYNFNKFSSSQGRDFGAYDYYSIMHYRATAFGINGAVTIVPKQSGVNTSLMGNGSSLSATDIAAAGLLYGNGGGNTDNCTTSNATSISSGYSAVVNGASKSSQCYVMDIPSNATSYTITTTGGSGDLDLYTQKSTIPTDSNNDCASKGSTSSESCSKSVTAGKLYIKLFGWSAYNNVTFSAKYQTGSGGGNGETYTGYLSGANQQELLPKGGSSNWFQYAGGTINATLTGPANADFELELRRWNGSAFVKVASSTSPTSSESISYSASSGYYQFRVYSYSGNGNYSLNYTK